MQPSQNTENVLIPWRKSIRFRVPLIVIATLVVVMGAVGGLRYGQIRKEVNGRLEDTAGRVASRLSRNLGRSVYSLAPEFALQILSAEMAHVSVFAIHVHEKEGQTVKKELFAGYGRDADWRTVPLAAGPIRGAGRHPVVFIETRDIFFSDAGEDRAIGVVHVHVTGEFAKAEIRKAGVAQLLNTAMAALAIGICLIILMRFATRPIADLAKVSSEITKGNFDFRINVNTENEFGLLADSLLVMRDSIKQQIHSLKEENTERIRVETALRESGEKYRALFEGSRDAIAMTAFDGAILDVNPAAIEQSGYSREELMNMNAERLYPNPEDRRRFRAVIEKHGAVGDFETRLRRKDGSEIDCLLTAGLWLSGNGPVGIQTIVRDVTAWKRTERELQRAHTELEGRVAERTAAITQTNAKLREEIQDRKKAEVDLKNAYHRLNQIIEFLPDATFGIDGEGTIIAWNQAMEKLTGLGASDVLGKGDYEYAVPFHGNKQPVMIDLVLRYDEQIASQYRSLRREGDRIESEICLPNFRGRGPTWVWLAAAPLYNEAGHIEGAIESIRDITSIKQTEERLRESREQFALFMDMLPHCVFIKDESSNVVYANQYVRKMIQCDDPIGKGPFDLLPDRQLAEALIADDRRALDRGPATIEEKMPDGNGKNRVFQTTKFPIPRIGKPALLGGIGLDITERVKAEEALRQSEERYKTLYREAKKTEELYNSLLNSTLDAIVSYDLENHVTYVNDGFTKTFGWVKEELANGVPYTPESELEITIEKVMRVVRDGVPIKDFETLRLTKEGRVLNVSISASRFNDHEGKPAGMLVILRDITERKQAQALLQEAKEAAEAAARAKSEFLANMSHEIRTPLNAILGLSHLALETRMTKQQQDYQQKIYASADTLLRLINDILDFSKIEAGKLDMEHRDFSVEEVIESVTSFIRVKSVEKGLAFSTAIAESVPSRLVGDSLRLGQVITNLVSNAVKFTQNGEVTVSVEPAEISDHRATLRFSISDTGIGMDREQVDRLFQPFQQADATITRKYGGTGLGLAISKRLIEMMGGGIRVDSESGMGTRFTFTACFGKSKKQASARLDVSIEQAAELLADRRVLLVEDNEINLQVARELLEHADIRVRTAKNGRQALELVSREEFDGILMDLHMPVMDGLTATRMIRKGPAPPDIPIIAMTASAMAGDREKCLEAGMNDHIAKPIKPANLYQTLIRRLRPDAFPVFSDRTPGESAPGCEYSTDCFPHINGLDVRSGLIQVSGDRELYLKVLGDVHTRFHDIVEQIRAMTENERFSAAERLAHTFKGIAGTIGAEELRKTAQDLERALEKKETHRIPDLFGIFAEEADRVMAALDEFLGETGGERFGAIRKTGDLKGPDRDRLKALLGELTRLINEGDSEAVDCVREIRELLGDGVSTDIRKLESQIREYEFEDALETFNRLSQFGWPEGNK